MYWSLYNIKKETIPINDNLEAIAKQLYDYWFVQFDFPNEEGKPYKSSGGAMVWNEKLKRKIPNGWTVETVGTYANCKSGYAIKSSDFKAKGIPVIKIGNIQEDFTLNMNGCQYIENNTNKLFYVYQNDVVIAMTGATIGKFAIVPVSETGYFVNQRVGKFELGNNPIKKMPYFINSLKIDYFRNQIFQLASGCAQPNISAEQINNISLLYPSTKILSEYNMKCKWMYEQIANCRYQIDVLTKLRDELLPLLMNGQATVNYHLSAKVYPLPIAYKKVMPIETNQTISNTFIQKFDNHPPRLVCKLQITPSRKKEGMTCNRILVATPANCYKGVVSTVSLVRSPSLFGDGFG